VTVIGTNFAGVTTVDFGSNSTATFTVISAKKDLCCNAARYRHGRHNRG